MDTNIVWFCVGVAIFTCLFIQLRNDISRMNKKLDKIAKHIGVDTSGECNDEELKKLILEGKKIEAIKRYRALTGEGLKEASDYVNSIVIKNEKV
ncbi:MAG: 50S ribosomal protein L7/L12 [Ruminiclostridium sp.]|nr:50S ribosomal protein L7/L12 [Ruminiclostridium sp.]